jgi:hypothetical protein
MGSKLLFTHGAVDAVFAGAYQQQGEEGGQIGDGHLLGFQRLTFYNQKEYNGKVDDQYKGGKTGEKTEDNQSRAENLREDTKHEGPPMADVQEVIESIFVLVEMSDLVQTMDDEQQEPERQAKDQGADIESAVRILSGEEFHMQWGFLLR